MNKSLRLILTIAFVAISSLSFAQKKVVISSAELQGPTKGSNISINKDGITITMSEGAMNYKYSYRLYQKATMTITSKLVTIDLSRIHHWHQELYQSMYPISS